MLMNLFSIFDPNTSLFLSLNWLSLIIPIISFPKMFWFKNSKFMSLIMLIIQFIYIELSSLLKTSNKMNMFMMMTIFYMILMMNFIGLFPFIFTPTTHLSITMPIALTLWFSMMIYGWLTKTNSMFTHLVPQNTPSILMPFMILIETISNLIRPLTLSIRLSANMIAGHMLLCLLGSTGSSLNILFLMLMLMIQLILMMLELSVSIIQSYVFMTLSSLYSNEI
uniref:ATP synthase subunit a n=1 Tax=Abispa ephippium TaxID=485912 RepID=B6RQY3_9HYME|nr:ATP synthase F0 subunit 6 [Abispa ephippium]